MGEGDDLTVTEAAEALGTSPQTVRTLLRNGELRGRKRPWGTRYVWVPSQQGVDEFLAEFGRLDGRRRRPPSVVTPPTERAVEPLETVESPAAPTETVPAPGHEGSPPEAPHPTAQPADLSQSVWERERQDRRPFVLRPRGRATVVVIILGIPMALAFAAARVVPGALWFEELGQGDVFNRVVAARVELYLLIAGTVAIFVGANLAIALRRTEIVETGVGVLGVMATAVVTATLFASATGGHWQTYELWKHRQTFGVVDPIHGKDVGFFVFTLPFERLVSGWLLWLIPIGALYAAGVYKARGALTVRPVRASFDAQLHLAALTAFFLLSVAWRWRLDQFSLELGQPSSSPGQAYAGAGYVDVHVRSPGLLALSALALMLAVACVATPFIARKGHARAAALVAGVPALLLLVGSFLVGGLIPALVQRYVVDPSPLASEQPYLLRSMDATRSGLGLDAIDVQPYSPTGDFSRGGFSALSDRLKNVQVWDSWVLQARMRELVTDTPYFSPGEPSLDAVRVNGRRQTTIDSARELDLRPLGTTADNWINDRVAYTHGLGLIRFSGTATSQSREPRALDTGLGLRQPRIYFGNLPQLRVAPEPDEDEPKIYTPTTSARTEESPWVLVDTRRPEVDIPRADGTTQPAYHYTGSGGIELSNWVRRAMFALALGSKELLLSDDITPDTRILLHRDVNDRLQTLAPFIQWDSQATPLTYDGRIVFVVDGYTTSQSYPYSEQVSLAGTSVSYARPSVRATVDAFSGRVDLYLVDPSDPIARAWSEIFPTLFRPRTAMPRELDQRLRYPYDLFAAQATAYERFHATDPDVFVSGSDAWTRPIALSGPLEVAGDVNFDESDEDELRLTMQPGYAFAPPPGQTAPRLILGTYYSPREGQNLVASLTGWIDAEGRARLASRTLSRDPVTLGPAQVSRLVFATPRVRNLLGLRNLEVRDLDVSSLDTVLLGDPRLIFLSGGVIQIQSLYEGSRGPGAARLLGVTAFLNGRAGLGPDIDSAIRQALNSPPDVDAVRPEDPVVVGEPVRLAFHVHNAEREVVTVMSAGGRQRTDIKLQTGRGAVEWTPSAVGPATFRVEVTGLDGTVVEDTAHFSVLSHGPTLKVGELPKRVVVGRPVRLTFAVTHAVNASAEVSTRSGIVFTRLYTIRNGTGVIDWTPKSPGEAVLLIRVGGHQGQTVRKKVRIDVAPGPKTTPPPTVTITHAPDLATVGKPADFAFSADGCDVASAQIEGASGEVRVWRFPCPADKAAFTWTPAKPGDYVLKVVARGPDSTTQVVTPLTVVRSR
jgi:uncharacterized protein